MKNIIFLTLALFAFQACSSDDNDSNESTPKLSKPAEKHHSNDGVTDNGDGSSDVTLGNVSFTTSHRDFSNDAVVTDQKMVNSTISDTYPMGIILEKFKVTDNLIIASENKPAFQSGSFLLYNMTSKKKLDERTSDDSYVAGFDFNGAIFTVEGAENLNFYKVEDEKIQKHFFRIKAFQGSKFLSECLIDGDAAYIYNSNEILTFKLKDTKTVSKLMDVPDFSHVNLSFDNKMVYISTADYRTGKVKFYDKTEAKVVKELPVSFPVRGITVDANYIYLSNKNLNEIAVFNKHTLAPSGKISIGAVTALDKVGEFLYAFSEDQNSIVKFKITFN